MSSDANAALCTALVVGAKNDSFYEMFEVHELTAAGAFLAGPLLLEPGEKMKLAFKFDDGTRIEVDATVDSAERNGTSGVRVVFKNGEKIAARLG